MSLSSHDLWEKMSNHWKSQVKKAWLAAVVAAGTVLLAPLLNPRRQPEPQVHYRPKDTSHAKTNRARYEERQQLIYYRYRCRSDSVNGCEKGVGKPILSTSHRGRS
jgi:hypothetical protein